MITKPSKPNNRSGFTLIEMTVVLTSGVMIAMISITLFNSQLSSYRILRAQNFLVQEAPQINNTLNSIVSRANFFRMYTSLEDATTGQDAVITGGTVLALKFENPATQGNSFGVIAFNAANNDLDYYHVESMAGLAVATSEWSVCSNVADADFFVQNGVLRIKLTGPNDEEIIYSTTTQR